MMKPSNPSRSHLETIQLSLQYASATAKASSAASRRFIFALKLSSTPVTATATTDGKRVSVHVCSFPSRTAACNLYAA